MGYHHPVGLFCFSLVKRAMQDQVPKKPNRPWRSRLKRYARNAGITLLVIYTVVWWFVLRIVEHDHWPPPADAVTSEQALSITQSFVSDNDALRDDIAFEYAPSTASDVQLFLDGAEFFPAMYADIESAEKSVHLLMFGFTPGGWGDEFADLLIRKESEGVEVRLIVDSQGSKAKSDNAFFFERLAEGGVQVVMNDTFPLQAHGEVPNRSHTWSQDEIGASDHRKMIVVDGRIGWVGGAGLEDHFDNDGWLDTFVRVEGDVVRQLQSVFCTSFHVYGGELPADLAGFFPRPDDAGDIRVTVLQNIPGGFVPGTQANRATIDSSVDTLDVLNAYFTDAGMVDRIVDASERGVDVRVFVSKDSNVVPAQYATLSQYDRLLNAEVEIWEVPGVMHAKVAVADDSLIIGSINYDAWALYRNLELALLIEDKSVANDARAHLVEPVLERANAGVPPDGWRETIPATIWWWLRYYL